MKPFRAAAFLHYGFVLAAGCGLTAGCGKSEPQEAASPVPANGISVSVNSGPATIGYTNGLFTSVTVCVPGTTNCQTIDSVLVDTGSVGLRVLSAGAAGGELSLSLPLETDANGNPIAECNAFVDSYTWGSVRTADVLLGSQEVHSMPIQVIGDPEFSDTPASCSAIGGAEADTLDTLGANAILGVGPVPQDCGGICSESLTAENTQNPGNVYYDCPSSGCEGTSVTAEMQLQNPVSMLATNNNGIVIDLSQVPASGAPSAAGTLLFGIGTESDNDLGSAEVLSIDPVMLTLSTTYSGQTYTSFVDSGSNAVYFLDPNLTNIAACTSAISQGFYCPSGTAELSATNLGIDGASSTVAFSVASADGLFANENDFAFDDLAGPSIDAEYVDWGLPFFFGRKIFFAIEDSDAPGGSTPYVAY